MYITYQYFADAIIGDHHYVNEWLKMCENTQLVDAQMQMARMVESGIPADQLKIERE